MKEKRTFGQNVLSFFGCLWPFLAFIGIQSIVSAAIVLWFEIPILFNENARELLQQTLEGGLTIYLLFVCTMTTSLAGYFWYKYRYSEYDYPAREVAKAKDIVYIIIMAVAGVFAINIIVGIIAAIFPKALDNYNELISESGLGNSLITFVIAAFIAPIGEECFYRGIIQRKAERFLPYFWANLLQAALFGIMHMNIIQGSYAFALGLLLGYVHRKYQSITMPVLLHMFFNIFGQTIPYGLQNVPNLVTVVLSFVSVGIIIGMVNLISRVYVSPKGA